MKLFKETKGVFKAPKKRYYIGKIVHGAPYFYPIGFVSTILKFRLLKLRDNDDMEKMVKDRPWIKKKDIMFSNMPMARRSKDWIFNIFNNWYWLQLGWPIYIYWHGLGWKDKFDSPRFEWTPAFYIFFFNYQFCTHWCSPDGDNDKYYEMILWWKNYSNKDIVKAKKTWGWVDFQTKKSTWNDNFLI